MNNEFIKKTNKSETRYILETTSGGTSSADVGSGSVVKVLGGVQKRADETNKSKTSTTPPKTRNPVAKNAMAGIGGGAAGAHKDKKRAAKHGETKHKKPYLEQYRSTQFRDRTYGLEGEKNNIEVSINGRFWKVFPGRGYADSMEEYNHLNKMKSWAQRKSQETGKEWTVRLTAQEPTNESHDIEMKKPDHEISMASNQLLSIIQDATRLLKLVRQYSEMEGLEAWQQSKLTKAADYLNAVLDNLQGKATFSNNDEQGVAEDSNNVDVDRMLSKIEKEIYYKGLQGEDALNALRIKILDIALNAVGRDKRQGYEPHVMNVKNYDDAKEFLTTAFRDAVEQGVAEDSRSHEERLDQRNAVEQVALHNRQMDYFQQFVDWSGKEMKDIYNDMDNHQLAYELENLGMQIAGNWRNQKYYQPGDPKREQFYSLMKQWYDLYKEAERKFSKDQGVAEGYLNEFAPNRGGDDGGDSLELPLKFNGTNVLVWPKNKKYSMGDTATPFPRGEQFTGKVKIKWGGPKIEAIFYLDPKKRKDREENYERVYGPQGRGYEDWLDHKWYDTTNQDIQYRFVTDWLLIPAKEPGGRPRIVDAIGQDMIDEVMNYPQSFITEIIQEDGDGRHFVEPRQSLTEGSSFETDQMVSYISLIIRDIYDGVYPSASLPRDIDENTYMKLVAKEMPHIVRKNPKLFRRAFGMAFNRFFHIDPPNNKVNYTDYSMRQGEMGRYEAAEGFADIVADSFEKGDKVEYHQGIWTVLDKDPAQDTLTIAKEIETVDALAVKKVRNDLEEKIKGVDGKACWKGYRYAGTENDKDKCVKVSEDDPYFESLTTKLSEKLDPNAPADEWIADFLRSKAPSVRGKPKAKRIQQALAAKYQAMNPSKKK